MDDCLGSDNEIALSSSHSLLQIVRTRSGVGKQVLHLIVVASNNLLFLRFTEHYTVHLSLLYSLTALLSREKNESSKNTL